MNVLHINSYAQAGGAEQVAVDLLNSPFVESRLLVRAHQATDPRIAAFPRSRLDAGFGRLDRVAWKLGFRNTVKTLFSIADTLNGTARKLAGLGAYREADVVHLHNLHGGYFDLAALATIAARKPVVWTLHDMWPMTGGEFYTYTNTNYQRGIGRTDIAYLYPLQQPLLDRRQHWLDRKKRLYAQLAGRVTFVPVSDWLADAFRSAYVYHPALRVERIYNGVDTTRFRNREERTWTRPRVLFFNARGEAKNSALGRAVLPRLNAPFDLYVVGEPLAHPAVVYHAPYLAERSALCDLYNRVDVLVFPSRAETFGLVPLEAMACGVCVVCADAAALPEVVNADTGLLFESENETALLDALSRALGDLPATRARGRRAAGRARTKFDLHQTQLTYFRLYERLLNERS